MLHLRLPYPAEATDAVLNCPRQDPGAAHLVALLAMLIAAAGALLAEWAGARPAGAHQP